MMTPERLVEVTLVELIVASVDSMARMCRMAAPQASVILAACAARLREEYPEVRGEAPDA